MTQFYFKIIVIAFAIVRATLAAETIEGTLLYKNPRTSPASLNGSIAEENSLQCPPSAMGPVCSTDCRTILTCVSGILISSSKCVDISSDYPYCTPNTFGCTAEPDLSYETCIPRTEPPIEFTCTGEGYFPSPHDCTEYFLCTLDSTYKYACPPNYVYDSNTHHCVHEGVCHTIDCTDSPNMFVVHPGNGAFYAFCTLIGGVTEIIIFRCDYPETHVFNLDKLNCEFKCREEGWFGHESNPSDFYECYYSEYGLGHRILSCPPDYIFDAEVKQCVPT